MQIETTQAPPENPVNGGDPTDQEALYAEQLEGLGDNPTEEPAAAAAAAAAPAAATDDAGADAGQAAIADAAAAADSDATTAAADVAAAPAPAPAAVATAPVVAAAAKPEAPKDFDAAYKHLQEQYDAGELDGDKLQAEQRALAREEGAHTARMTIWEEGQRTAAQQAEQDFNATALNWEANNKDFMANTTRAQLMQQTLAAIDQQTGGKLPPAELFARAQKDAFEAFNYAPTAAVGATSAADKAKAIAAATAARKPAPVPQTLANADAAAPIEAGRNSTFDGLDSLDISSLEDALARMPAAQREAYLAGAPGAKSLAIAQ